MPHGRAGSLRSRLTSARGLAHRARPDALADAVSRTGRSRRSSSSPRAFVEYVFPPFPGDLVVVLGAWYAVQGELSWPATFVSSPPARCSAPGSTTAIGAALGRRLDRRLATQAAALRGAAPALRGELPALGRAAPRREPLLPGHPRLLLPRRGRVRHPAPPRAPLRRPLGALWNAVLLGAGRCRAQRRGAPRFVRALHAGGVGRRRAPRPARARRACRWRAPRRPEGGARRARTGDGRRRAPRRRPLALPEGTARYRVEVGGVAVGVAELAVRCEGPRCRVRREDAPQAPGGGGRRDQRAAVRDRARSRRSRRRAGRPDAGRRSRSRGRRPRGASRRRSPRRCSSRRPRGGEASLPRGVRGGDARARAGMRCVRGRCPRGDRARRA